MRIPLMLTIASTLAIAAIAAVAASPAAARTIVLTNDDGLTSNLVALHAALTEAGHDVIVSVPCQNQSGMGAAIAFSRPLAPLTQACRHDAAQAGDPGAGPMTRADLPPGDFYYVDGSPVLAMLHGIHVAGQQRWGAMPDLVLSGPNEGQNVGAIILSSGTVSAAQAAAIIGLPAVALSAGANTDGPDLANPLSPDIARLSLQLVQTLDDAAGDGPLLPQGTALNVNFPDNPAGAHWRLTRIGSYNAYLVGFTMDMAQSASPTMRAMAAAQGAQLPALPGISFDMNSVPPRADQLQDESVVVRQHITVSPMNAGYETTLDSRAAIAGLLASLLETDDD